MEWPARIAYQTSCPNGSDMMLTREGFVIGIVVFEDTERERKA